MTIKTRNRILFSIFIASLLFLITNLAFFIFALIKYPILSTEAVQGHSLFRQWIFDYQPLAVYNSIIFMNVFAMVVSHVSAQAFEKTQSSELSFFFCFLVACLAECVRMYIPVLVSLRSFSSLIVFMGRFSTFARILAPLALLFSAIMSGSDQRQNLARNTMLIIVISVFFAFMLPLNTGVLEKSFRIHVGFDKIIVCIEILVHSSAIISLFINNRQNGYSQMTTLGMMLLIAGFVLGINGINFFLFFLSTVCSSAGAFLYLNSLHNRHLYE